LNGHIPLATLAGPRGLAGRPRNVVCENQEELAGSWFIKNIKTNFETDNNCIASEKEFLTWFYYN
jgi:hypothetical protein